MRGETRATTIGEFKTSKYLKDVKLVFAARNENGDKLRDSEVSKTLVATIL